MKKILMFLALVGLIGAASASTDFTYSAATDGSYLCGTYCSGFVSSDAAHTVEYANVTYYYGATFRVAVSVDGQSYQGYTTSPGTLSQLTELNIVNGIAVYGTRTILASEQYTTRTTCVRQGRGQHCRTTFYTFAGSVSLL